MTNGQSPDPLKELGRRLDEAQRARGNPRGAGANSGPTPFGAAMAWAWRVGLELLVAVVVGTGIGWALDQWLGTRPWGMIVMFFLGVATGMVNVWRAVTGGGMAVGYRKQQGDAPRAGEDGWEDED